MNLYLVQYKKDGEEERFAVYVVDENMEMAMLKMRTQIFFKESLDFVDISLEDEDVIV